MATRYQDLLNQYAQAGAGATQASNPNLDAYGAVAASGSGAGLPSANQMEIDARTMDPTELYLKYGDAASGILNQLSDASRQVMRDEQTSRSAGDILFDSLGSAAKGVYAPIGGLVAGGIGLVSPKTGVAIARGVDTIGKTVDQNQSEGMKAAQRLSQAVQNLSLRDNAAEFHKDLASGKSEFTAGLARVGKDVVSTLQNMNATTAGDLIANAAGSLVMAGPAIRALESVGIGAKSAGAITAGLQEAGGAYQQNAAQNYDALIAQGVSPDEAARRANYSGLEAGAIQGPAAAVVSRIAGTGEFEANPFRSGSLGGVIGNVVKEGVEEGIQSATGQLAQNIGTQDQINPNQDLSEGVGEQIASGAIGGLGSAGVTQAPHLALQTSVESAKLPFKALSKGLTYAGDRLDARNQRVQDDLLAGLTDQAEASVPEMNAQADSPIKKAAADTLSAGVAAVRTMQQKATEFAQSNDLLGKFNALGDIIKGKQASELAQETGIPEGTGSVFQNIKDTVANAANSESVQSALEAGRKIFDEYAPRISTAFDNAIKKAPKEGFEDVQNNIPTMEVMADLSPEKTNLKTINDILYHDEQGNITLTPAQRATFRSARTTVEALQSGSKLLEDFGFKDAGRVSEEVLTKAPTEGQKLSVKAHLAGIMAAYNAGNLDGATEALGELRNFGQHLINKVQSFNDALIGGNTSSDNPLKGFSVHIGKGKFRPTGETYIQPRSAGSVKLSQEVLGQATVVSNLVNGLADNLGLNIQHLSVPALDASLNGEAQVVAKEFRTGQRQVPTQANEAEVAPTTPVEEASANTTEPVVEEVTTSEQNTTETEPSVNVQENVEPEVPATEEKPQENNTSSSEPEAGTAVPEAKAVRAAGEKNRVARAFKEPKNARTRVSGSDSPMQTVKDILRNGTTMREALGDLKRSYSDETAAAYKAHLGIGDQILSKMQDRLKDFAAKKLNRGRSAEEIADFLESGAFHAAIENADGTYSYDPKIVEPAVLAGLQYLLAMNSKSREMTDQEIKSMLDIGPDAEVEVSDDLVQDLAGGLSSADIVRSLSQKIGQFIGLQEDRNAPENFANSVIEGLAKEFLEAVTTTYNNDGSVKDQGLININRVDTSNVSSIPFVNRYYPATIEAEIDGKKIKQRIMDPAGPMKAFPNAIEAAVLINPEKVNYIGEVPGTPSKTQMGSDNPITDQQVKDIEAEQATPHYLSKTFITHLLNMGEARMLDLFAGGDVTRPLNKNHKKSLEGRNLTFKMALDSIKSLNIETESAAESLGLDKYNTPIHYAYAYSSNNRMMMLGENNPQGNKLMREAVLPTWDTIDLTDDQNMYNYNLGLAQALGVKVHTLNSEGILKKLSSVLDQLENTVGILADEDHKWEDIDIDLIKQDFSNIGEKITPVAIHALMDYARMINAEDITAHRTALYFEADGVTNGVINAMSLFSAGDFTENWVSNMERGGFSVGEETPQSLAQLRGRNEDSNRDLYKVSADHTVENVKDLRSSYAGTLVGNQMDRVVTFLTKFMSGVDYDAKGDLVIDRGATKNPLTITIYGSGANGIAGNLLNASLSALYERMSLAAQRKAEDKSLSPAEALGMSDAEFSELMVVIGDLATKNINKNKEGELYVRNADIKGKLDFADFENFTISPQAYKVMQQNILYAFVEPMVGGIKSTVGSTLIDTMDLIKNQTNIWSAIGQFKFQNAYNVRLQEKREANPDMNSYELLSKNDVAEILKEVGDNLPHFSTGTQNYFFGGSTRYDLPFMTSKQGNRLNLEFSRSLTDGFHTPAYGYMPGRAGVSGQPLMTIGNGDGQAVQNIIENPKTPKKRLQIFDGIHSTVSEIGTMAEVANQGVADSWKQNPLSDLARAFVDFNNDLDLTDLTDDQRRSLGEMLRLTMEDDTIPTAETLKGMITFLAEDGTRAAEQMDKRIATLKKVATSTDQMAGGAKPYYQNGILLSGSAAEKSKKLNKLMAGVDPEAEEVASGEDVINISDAPKIIINRLTDKMIINATSDRQERAMLREIMRSGAVENVEVHIGTREFLNDLADKMGIQIPTNRAGWKGFSTGDHVFVIDGNSETLLHEMIHAATYNTVQSHYAGQDTGIAKPAILRLETLMAEFKEANLEGRAYQDSLDEIERQEDAGNKAGALNEFMAWSLANQEIGDQIKNVKIRDRFARIAREGVRYIKNLLWGEKRSAAVKSDLFSNIRFNTAIIARTQNPSLVQNSLLFHMGTDDRINALSEKIKNKVADFIGNDRYSPNKRDKLKTATIHGASIAIMASKAGFDFTPEQHATFVNMVGILSTAAEINPNAFTRARELYSHAMKSISFDDFLRNAGENDSADNMMASDMFDLMAGKLNSHKDQLGRDATVPAFIALALTNDQVRELVRNIPMPKGSYPGWNTVDDALDTIGESSMDTLARALSGEGIRSQNVTQALDGLANSMLDTQGDKTLYIEKYTNPIGNAVDKANTKVIEGFTALGEYTNRLVENQKGKGRFRENLAEFSNIVAGMLHEPTGHETSIRLMEQASASKLMPQWAFDLLNDMIGRTRDNADIYDLIKKSRQWVSANRQQYVEHLPQIINSKFKTALTDVQQTHLFNGLARTDIASLLSGSQKFNDIVPFLTSDSKRDLEIKRLKDVIRNISPENADLIIKKAGELSDYMVTRQADTNLLRNADAIANLLGEGVVEVVTSPQMIEAIDHLVSLQALANQTPFTREAISYLAKNEAEGLEFMLSTLKGVDNVDKVKATGNARFNYYKGYMNSQPDSGLSLIVAHDTDAKGLLEKGFVRLGPLAGSSRDPSAKNRSYWYAPVSGRAPFAQGIMQNVQQTVGGVNKFNGSTNELTGGRIADVDLVEAIQKSKAKETKGTALMPLYDQNGKVIGYERQVSPAMVSRLKGDTNLAKMIGIRAGRQVEEAVATKINTILIDNLKNMYDAAKDKSGFINLNQSTDPVIKDAMNIFSHETRQYIDARFPKGFMVRKDMINDAIGYRNASVGDVWTGTSRWSPAVQNHVKQALKGMFGNKAYIYATKAERFIQNSLVQDLKTTIVIRSIIVPMANAASNIYQLIGRGVPYANIFRSIPKKVAEIDAWQKSTLRSMEAQAELRVASDRHVQDRLRNEIKAIKDSHKRLSIWPLLENGEFSSISDAGSREDQLLTEGKLSEFLEAMVDKLPDGVRTAGKYAIVSKDTALFRGLQKTVDYGDFVAKAILYDDLVKRQGKTKSDALGKITEEFINYDRLPGRDRAYLESMGLMWFWNFKIRSSKVAMSMIRNNPVHALIAANLPTPIAGVGLPLDDNLWSSLFDGRALNSIGYHMGFRAPGLLPLGNLLS